MKMRQLKDRLTVYGALVSERMVKYYIETSLIPPPKYPRANQAEYSEIHFVRLLRISAMKAEGSSNSQIRAAIADSDEFCRKLAENRGISYGEAVMLPEIASREFCEFLRDYPDNKDCSARELIALVGCEKMVFDLAKDTGVLEEKELYTATDKLILFCINSLFLYGDAPEGADIIERISEVSKINNIANSLASYYGRNTEKTWIYKNLTESVIRGKLEKKWAQNKN